MIGRGNTSGCEWQGAARTKAGGTEMMETNHHDVVPYYSKGTDMHISSPLSGVPMLLPTPKYSLADQMLTFLYTPRESLRSCAINILSWTTTTSSLIFTRQ